MAKRKAGEGSWGKKTIKGVVYKYYRKQYEGMSNPKYFYGKTEKEIKKKIKAFEEGRHSIIPEDVKKQIFSDYIINWLQNIKQPKIKRRTYDGYEDIINSQIINYKDYDLAGKQMGSLNSDILQEYYNSLAKKYARSSIKKNLAIVRQCLDYAKSKNHIEEAILDTVELPSEDVVAVKKKEIPFLPEEDMEKLYQESKRINVKGANYGGKIGKPVYGNNAYAIVLIMYTGLRIGELLALQWKDVDLENKFIHVRTNLSTIKNRNKKSDDDNNYVRVATSTKTYSGYRDIPLSKRAIEMINKFHEFNPNHKPDDYVILSLKGNIINQRNLTRTLHAMLKRANCSVAECGLHALRHTFGSYLILHKVDIKVVSQLLGHKNVAFTYNVYIHLIKKQQIEAVNLFDNDGLDI